MATYKIPDVYVEEISILPPSVAEVETAIPAFIGFTERASKDGKSLHMKPTRISSLLEFRTYYGGGPSLDIASVKLNEDNSFSNVTLNGTYYMFDSLRMYYDNGGGDCYIVSIGKYGDPLLAGDDGVEPPTGFKGGLKVLEKYDEPTIILFPDGVKLGNDLYSKIQPKTLEYCASMMDRVGVFDLLENDPNGTTFRDNVGMKNLKYGMAYTPWLKVNLSKNVRYRDLLKAGTYESKLTKSAAVPLSSLTSEQAIKTTITNLENIIKDVDKIAQDTRTGLLQNGAFASTGARYQSLRETFNAAGTDQQRCTAITAMIQFLYDIASTMDTWTKAIGQGGLNTGTITTAITNTIDSELRSAYSKLRAYENELNLEVVAAPPDYVPAVPNPVPGNGKWNSTGGDNTTNVFTAVQAKLDVFDGTDTQRMTDAAKLVDKRFEEINAAFNAISGSATELEKNGDTVLTDSFPAYRNIAMAINDSSTSLPPSGAIAGVYATTDRTRGVWKAPANVSLSSVIGPGFMFNTSQLEQLNIDVNGGKSINAIRSFTGRGTLVWGARTLAGNDNEWRYVNVRRFYNMVEESIKKSTYWAVFEPNNANTWVKVKGMIDNYLTNKWKEGALVGAKPDEAFFVKIGLGSTMTAQDILNGYMNVEIGMAVARPAEFIVLKFSHKLQQS